MALTVLINDSSGHLGTFDRQQMNVLNETEVRFALSHPGPPTFFDYPGKHAGFTSAVHAFGELTTRGACPFVFVKRDGSPYPEVVVKNSSRVPTHAELTEVHAAEYLSMLRRQSANASQMKIPLVYDDNMEAHISPGTERAAKNAVGACLDAVDVVFETPGATSFANVWPPGHHAESSRRGYQDLAMGFCYLSNAAIAALYARDHTIKLSSNGVNRVLVIDIDNHAGNGTRSALVNEPNTMVVDLVQRSPFDGNHYVDGYIETNTGLRTGQATEFPSHHNDPDVPTTAHHDIVGDNIVVLEFFKKPSPIEVTKTQAGSGMLAAATPDEILTRFIEVALPRIAEFKPDVIIWSIGLDSAQNDVLGGMGHVAGSFYTMIRGIRLAFPNTRQLGVAEGGYVASNWKLLLPPILAAFHVDPQDQKNHSSLFARYANKFHN